MSDRRAAVFLDRDGTINVSAAPHEYIRDAAEFRWLPGALSGLLALGAAGLPLIVVSNQRGVSRGLVTLDGLNSIEQVIQGELAPHGVRIESFRYCFHDLQERCACRKPQPGMLLDAARELDLDLPRSWMIGDSDTDVQAGVAAGCRTIQIVVGRPQDRAAGDRPDESGGKVVSSLREAAELVLADRATG